MKEKLAFFMLLILLWIILCFGEPQWIKGDNQLHTTFSDGSGAPAQKLLRCLLLKKEVCYHESVIVSINFGI